MNPFDLPEKITILGTEYTIFQELEANDNNLVNTDAYTDSSVKKIVVARNVRKRGKMRKLRAYKRLVIELLNFLIDLCFYYDRIYRKENNPFLSDMYEHAGIFNEIKKELEGRE